jgi:head-tail adaptor
MSVILQPIRGGKSYMQGKDSVIANYRMWVDGKKDDRTARTISESQQIIYGSRRFNILFVADQLEQGSMYVVDMVEVPFDKGASDD